MKRASVQLATFPSFCYGDSRSIYQGKLSVDLGPLKDFKELSPPDNPIEYIVLVRSELIF